MTVPSAWAAAPHHIALHVSDLDASELFYARFLGARRISARSAEEPYIGTLTGHPTAQIRSVMLNLPGTTVALELLAYSGIERAPSNAERAEPGTAHLGFFVADVDAIYRAWRAAGVRAVSPPVTPTAGPNQGGRVVYMLDPDGIRIELIAPRPSGRAELGD